MMRTLWLLAVVVAVPAGAVETMRIAVGPEVSRAVVTGPALALGLDVDDGAFTSTGKTRLELLVSKDGLVVNGEKWAGASLRVRAGQAGLEPISVNGTQVRGDLVAIRQGSGLLVVNVLPLEDYLVGVLGSEMPKSFPVEALKAQAVAARTYALHRKLTQYGQATHLGSNVLSQVYGGLASEDPRTREAVEATQGQVLTFDLQPIEAYFHSSCGGRTESGVAALNRDLPYLKAVECPCHTLPSTSWSLSVEPQELQKLVGSKPSNLQVGGRTPTGRARRVELGQRSVDAVWLRERLGYGRLKSLKFEVEPKGQGWLFKGAGFGHGAGLCQWGARLLAEQGKRYDAILAHYYPGAELQTLY